VPVPTTWTDAWQGWRHVDLVVRASDGRIVRPVRAPDSSFAVQVGIATAALVGVVVLAFLAWRRRLLKEIMR